MAVTEARVALVQRVIYRVRWIDAFKDGEMATDEAIAKAVVKALDERGL